ncbi:MAG: gliding motility lipoprotein GldH [Bacteroidales bacterium]|nr:gliding motility lipoprotein GldH [Bacteroidales bacterium]
MQKENNTFMLLAAVLLSSVIIISCTRGDVYTDSRQITEYSWHKNNELKLEADIQDTISAFDINLVIRTNNNYPYRNIFLFITTLSPAGQSITDTVEYYLADEKGNWYGSGLGDVNDLSVPFKNNVIFPQSGIYTFNIKQGMREVKLEGVTDIGIRIKKIKQ